MKSGISLPPGRPVNNSPIDKKPSSAPARNIQSAAQQKNLIENRKAAAQWVAGKIINLLPNQQAQCLKNIRQPVNTGWIKGTIEARSNGQCLIQTQEKIGFQRKTRIENTKRGPRLFGKDTEAHLSLLSKDDSQGKPKITHASLLPPAIEVTRGFESEPQAHKIEINEMPKPQKAIAVALKTVSLPAAELGSARLFGKKDA